MEGFLSRSCYVLCDRFHILQDMNSCAGSVLSDMTQGYLGGTSCMSVLNFLSVIIASHTGYHAQRSSIDLDVARAVLMLVMNEI